MKKSNTRLNLELELILILFQYPFVYYFIVKPSISSSLPNAVNKIIN